MKRIYMQLDQTKEKKHGFDKGQKIGYENGTKQGAKKEKISIVKKMLKLKMPIVDIMEVTGISEEEIEKIEKEEKI